MGVLGLTTFIEENPDLLQDFHLQNTKVVIDGNNLYHQLYYHYHVPYQFNGDYDQFSLKVHHFFKILKACDISPVIVFDGGYETDDRKLHTSLERARNRLHLAGFISHGDRGKILPILAYETFKHVLVDLGIPHVTCDFEADSEIAVLANDLSCPVISLDSDFYVLDVKGGYIPFNSMNFSVQCFKDNSGDCSSNYLPSRIYFTDNFVKKFPSLNKSALPLIATLMGNDFINVKFLDEFYSNLKAPKTAASEFCISKKHTKMSGILNWLSQINNVEQAVEKILNSVKLEKRDQLQYLLNKSIAAFSGPKTYTSFNLYKFLSDSDCTLPDGLSTLRDYYGTTLPGWFCLAHRRTQIPVAMLNAVLLHRIIFLSQVEDMHESSSFHCAVRLRQIIYGILVRRDIVTDKEVVPSKKTHIEEYGREIKNIKKSLVLPLMEIADYGCLPSLEDLPSLDTREKVLLLSRSFEVQSLLCVPFPDDLKVIAGSIVFWIKHAKPKISKNHLKAMLVGVLILNVKHCEDGNDIFDRSNAQDEHNNLLTGNNCIMEVIKKSSTKHLQMAHNSLKKYFVRQEKSKKIGIDVKIIHAFSQFQSCAVAAIHLNQLLGCPVESASPAVFFNGTFLYNFCRDLNTRSNVDLFIAEMLVKSSPLLELYNIWLSWILENVQEEFFLEVKSHGSKRNKRQRKNKEDSKNNDKRKDGEGDVNSDDCERKGPKVTMKAACSLTNRFEFLELEDSS